VAHSLGCALVAHLSQSAVCAIGGALLVAPADVDNVDLAGGLVRSFAPMPQGRLPFPSLMAASRDDSFMDVERARALARVWG
jgi:predicted alpha/beta hydrolase family esterase